MDAAALAGSVQQRYPNLVVSSGVSSGDAYVVARREGIRALLSSLRSDAQPGFDVLMDLFAVDYLHWEDKECRFEVVYNLFSVRSRARLFVKVLVPESDPVVDSAVPVWPAADWYEREVWDMYGVSFKGHPNLKRILMYEGFDGHALRKDYPFDRRQPIIGPVN